MVKCSLSEVCVIAEPPLEFVAREAAIRWGASFHETGCPAGDRVVLNCTAQGWILELPEKGGRIHLDFSCGAHRYRQKRGGRFAEPLAKAMRLGQYESPPTILDATAGFGGDSILLASLGCRVIACERSPIVFELLSEACLRARSELDLQLMIDRIELNQIDAADYLTNCSNPIDIVYLDPMFPRIKSRSALSKKEMRALRLLVGEDLDADKLLTVALSKSRKVVVKRFKEDPYLLGKLPTWSWSGGTNRFDVYIADSN